MRDFLTLFFPLLGTSFSNYLFLLVEKVFLARVSSIAMEAAVGAMYVSQIFQGTSVACAMVAQVFVARWYGARSWTLIGPGIWQFIWFAILSSVLIIPLGVAYGGWYFEGADTASIALPYFHLFLGWNFLYPLGMVLACFYLGQGKTRLVLTANLIAQGVKIALAYLLIFGWDPWIPSLGIMGGAISTLTAQGAVCCMLFAVFLNKKHQDLFHSRLWKLKFTLFFECLRACLSRAANRLLNFTSWAAIAHLMVVRGGEYSLILSTGGVITLFLPFLFEAVCQAQLTTVSFLVGSGSKEYLDRAIRSGFAVVATLIVLVGIPFCLFPSHLFLWLFPGIALTAPMIETVCLGIWLCFTFYTLNAIPQSIVLSCRDLTFPLWMGCVNWINGYLLMYVFVELLQIPAHFFWVSLALMHGTTFALYLWRMRVLYLAHRFEIRYE